MKEFAVWFVCSLISTFGFSYLFCNLSDSKVKMKINIMMIFTLGVLFLSLIKYYKIKNSMMIN